MNEDLYLQRLRSIREKYTSANKALTEQRNTDFSYRPIVNPEHNIPRQRVDMTPTKTRPLQAEFVRTPAQFTRSPPKLNRTPITRVERSYSLADNTAIPTVEPYAYDASQKRMDNFTTFIRDLDQRIQEKQRALNSKIRFNDCGKQREEAQYDTMKTLNRYSSTKDVCKPISMPLHEAISRVVPREAYERSLVKRDEAESRRGMSNHDIQNVLQRKWIQESGNSQKLKAAGPKAERLKINEYTSPLGISKQANLAAQDNWSIGKLDNIQKRIKAVLG